jgi:hypothetical protein
MASSFSSSQHFFNIHHSPLKPVRNERRLGEELLVHVVDILAVVAAVVAAGCCETVSDGNAQETMLDLRPR